MSNMAEESKINKVTTNNMLRHIILKIMTILDKKYNLNSYRQDSKLEVLMEYDDPYSISQRISKIVRQTQFIRIGNLNEKCAQLLQHIVNNYGGRNHKVFSIYGSNNGIDIVNFSKAFLVDNYISIDQDSNQFDYHDRIPDIINDFDNIFREFYAHDIYNYINNSIKNNKSIKLYKFIYNSNIDHLEYLYEPFYSLQFKVMINNEYYYTSNVVFLPLKAICFIIVIKSDIHIKDINIYYSPYNFDITDKKNYIMNLLDNIFSKYIANPKLQGKIIEERIVGFNKVFTGNILNNLIIDVVDSRDNKYFMLFQNQTFKVINKVSDIKIISNNYYANKVEVKNAIEYIDTMNSEINEYLCGINHELNEIDSNLLLTNKINTYIDAFLRKFCAQKNLNEDFLDDKVNIKISCKIDSYNAKMVYTLSDDYNDYSINLINIQFINDGKNGFLVHNILNLDSFTEYDDIELIKKEIIGNGGSIIQYNQLQFINELVEFLMKSIYNSINDNYLKTLSKLYYNAIKNNVKIHDLNDSIDKARKTISEYKSGAYFENMINNACNNVTYNGNIDEFLLEIQYYLNIHDNKYYANMFSV